MLIFCSALFATAAVVAIVSELARARTVHYAAKPATMLVAIAIPLANGFGPAGTTWWYGALVVAGLCFSIIGDVLLMLETDLFVAGLVSFLVAHVCYIAAFATAILGAADGGVVGRAALWAPLAVLVVYAVVTFKALRPGLGEMTLPVGAYVAVITVMGWLATADFALNPSSRTALGLAGAVLFMASDTLLAVDRFRKRLPYAQAFVLGTYFAAQWCLAVSTIS